MSDGTLIFDTRVDTKGVDAGTEKIKVQFQKATDDVKRQAAAVQKLEAEYRRWADTVADVKVTGGKVSPELQSGTDAAAAKLDTARIRLDQLSIKAQETGGRLREALNPEVPKLFANATKSAEKRMARFRSMLERVIMRAALLVAVSRGIQKIKEYFNSAMKTNEKYTKAVGQLKAALMTLAQPLLNTILPAFIKMAQVLAIIVTALARFFSMLSGSSLKASQDSAEALYGQQQALDGVGASAKKAGKALASFDEINKISETDVSGAGVASAEEIAPDFSALDDTDGKLQKIAQIVGAIGAGLLLWKISSAFSTGLAATAQTFIGLGIAIFGAYEFYKAFIDAIENGVDWTNLQEMIIGVALAATGLYIAFGAIGAGIALVVGGLLMLYAGFSDIIKNGANLKNTLLVIAGIIATGLGISLLTGSLIPLLVGGIADIVVAVLALTGNLEEFVANLKDNILGGLIDFIAGVFTGDWERAWGGVKKIFTGIWNTIVIVLESAVNLIIKGINWLINRLNTIQVSIPDWVPGIGGKSYGINIPNVSEIKIPRLATGAVIPPNSEFLAVLGDQKRGTNIEAPLETMVQAFRQAMRESGGGGRNITVVLELDRREFGRAVYKVNNEEHQRVGVRFG